MASCDRSIHCHAGDVRPVPSPTASNSCRARSSASVLEAAPTTTPCEITKSPNRRAHGTADRYSIVSLASREWARGVSAGVVACTCQADCVRDGHRPVGGRLSRSTWVVRPYGGSPSVPYDASSSSTASSLVLAAVALSSYSSHSRPYDVTRSRIAAAPMGFFQRRVEMVTADAVSRVEPKGGNVSLPKQSSVTPFRRRAAGRASSPAHGAGNRRGLLRVTDRDRGSSRRCRLHGGRQRIAPIQNCDTYEAAQGRNFFAVDFNYSAQLQNWVVPPNVAGGRVCVDVSGGQGGSGSQSAGGLGGAGSTCSSR